MILWHLNATWFWDSFESTKNAQHDLSSHASKIYHYNCLIKLNEIMFRDHEFNFFKLWKVKHVLLRALMQITKIKHFFLVNFHLFFNLNSSDKQKLCYVHTIKENRKTITINKMKTSNFNNKTADFTSQKKKYRLSGLENMFFLCVHLLI